MSKLFVIKTSIMVIAVFTSAQPFGPIKDVEMYDKIVAAAEATKRIINSLNFFYDHVDISQRSKLSIEAEKELTKIANSIKYYTDFDGTVRRHPELTELYERFQSETSFVQQPSLPDTNDPLATDENINYVLRNYYPLTKMEKSKMEVQRMIRRKSSDVSSESNTDEIDATYHNVDERKYYRHLIKRYYIVNPKLIQTLVEVRYEILRDSLKGKSLSHLRAVEQKLFEERLLAQIKVWKRNKKFGISDEDNMFALVSSDHEYRKYLNLHDDYSQGNIIHGYKNRYDDPASHDINFEVTAFRIIGKRFVLMQDLSNEVRKFNMYYQSQSKFDINDLPMIDYHLKYFAMLTFEFPESRFKAKQWSALPSKTDDQTTSFMVIPKNYKSKNPDEIRKRIDDDISIAKAAAARDKIISVKPNANSIQKSLLTDRRYVSHLGTSVFINSMNNELKNTYLESVLEEKKIFLSTLKKKSLKLNENLKEFGVNMDHFNDGMIGNPVGEVRNLFNNYDDPLKSEMKSSRSTDFQAMTSDIHSDRRIFGDGGDAVSGGFYQKSNSNHRLDHNSRKKKKTLNSWIVIYDKLLKIILDNITTFKSVNEVNGVRKNNKIAK